MSGGEARTERFGRLGDNRAVCAGQKTATAKITTATTRGSCPSFTSVLRFPARHQRVPLGLLVEARTREEALARRPFQREHAPAPRHDVDDQLRMAPVRVLRLADVERHPADVAEMD